MIPPADSLLKYDNPVLVSKNTEKKSPKVGYSSLFIFCLEFFQVMTAQEPTVLTASLLNNYFIFISTIAW